MFRVLVAIAWVVGVVGGARADPDPHRESHEAVALLPLDAEARLEIYGQAVASELSVALVAAKIEVVVVGSKMAVPARARLVVDGTIASKGSAVILSVRIRNPVDGKILDTESATAPNLENIDRAAAELSARVLPAVRKQLAALAAPLDTRVPDPNAHQRVVVPQPVAAEILIAVVGGPDSMTEPLRLALAEQVIGWCKQHHREPRTVDVATLEANGPSHRKSASSPDLAIRFEVVGYTSEPAGGTAAVSLARARVGVRIETTRAVELDRVVVTDSIVGDRQMPPAALAARVAVEVLAILQPHLHRLVATWR